MMSFFLLLLLLQSSFLSAEPSSSSSIAKPGCKDHCGKLRIPYPFGIGPDCFHDAPYEILCNNTSSDHSKAFLKYYNVEVTDITFPDTQEQKLTVLTPVRNICGIVDGAAVQSMDFRGSPYRFSSWSNVFMVEGCSGSAVLKNKTGQILAGCASVCPNDRISPASSNHGNVSECYGDRCCQSTLLPSPNSDILESGQGLDFYEIFLTDRNALTSSNSTCSLAAGLIKIGSSLEKLAGKLSNLSSSPTVLEWRADYMSTTKKYDNFSCYEDDQGKQYCSCNFPYQGLNPFLPYGCEVVPECQKCRRHCSSNDYNGTTSQYYCQKKFWLKQPPVLGFSTGMGLVLLVLGCYWLHKLIKWRRQIKQKAKYFKRNGGLLLQQQMSSSDGVVETTTIFAITELEKATDNFNENRVLGQGGQGTVYKGMLMDGRIVAIKKSKKVNEGQLDQFINEVVILSQVNHRNVVKLLGCCLETEVPLLVYEFIPNGTLYQHIHDPTEDFHVTWKMRLQIATESAGALAYLHSSSSAPIYHRDIKSSNILLDEKYRAKVSDFGTSRAISIEQTHVTTSVQGTYGYLDPEYFQSNQFTEKSDVYSFGVVLAELITGKKPVCPTESGGLRSLATEFLYQMENSRLLDIVDARVIEEGNTEEFIAIADLARHCLNMNGKQRPTMKEVATVLDGIPLSNRKELYRVNEKYAVTEIMDTGPSSRDMFSDNDSCSSWSIEVQPLMSNTH